MAKGDIVHIEIPSADRAASVSFYSKLFGWETQEWPQLNYTTFMAGKVGGGSRSQFPIAPASRTSRRGL